MDDKSGAITFNQKAWLSMPAVIGISLAPADLTDVKYTPAGSRITGTLFPPGFFNGDPSTKPKGALSWSPTPELRDFLLELRKRVIAALAASNVKLGRTVCKKEYDKLTTTAAKIKFITDLADKEEGAELHFPMQVDHQLSTATETVYKVKAKHNIFKATPEGETSKPRPEFGADVATWMDQHPNDHVDTPDPRDMHGDPLPWSVIRANKPDSKPTNFAGFIREFCISAQPVNKEAGGKIFFNTSWAATLQIASYEKSSGAVAEVEDMSHFFM